jgi:PIN domain nuclease of toxin-antitoxin system
LLDTPILLYALIEPSRLPLKRVFAIRSKLNAIFFSSASIWEVALKAQSQPLLYPFSADEVADAAVKTGFTEIPLLSDTVAKVSTLPDHHKDPFDRLLVAQAMMQPARFLTNNPTLTKYSDIVELM